MFEGEVKHWWELRTLEAPDSDMLDGESLIKRTTGTLKTDSPRKVEPRLWFVKYDRKYIQYCFLKHFYEVLFVEELKFLNSETGEENIARDRFLDLIGEGIEAYREFCWRSQPTGNTPYKTFQLFCQEHLFK